MKPYVESSIKTIKDIGYVRGYNNKEYNSPVDFLDDSVVSIVEYVMKNNVEKDINLSEAFAEAGIVQGYLDNTSILGKVVKSQNPLRGLFK